MNDRRRRDQPGEARPLFDDDSERALIGICLQDPSKFWEGYSKIQPETFGNPRLGKIWAAMSAAAAKGKPINQTWIALLIDPSDAKEDTPTKMFLSVLANDAPTVSDFDAYCDTVLHLSSKRSLVEAMDRAKAEILASDVSMPPEHMRDIGMKRLSAAFSADGGDDDMMSYAEWGARVAKAKREQYDAGEDAQMGLDPGLAAVQRVFGRLMPGKEYVLAGMSSSGKSALVRQIAEGCALSAAAQNLGYGYIASLEMTGDEYAIRSIAERCGIPADEIEQGNLNNQQVGSIEDHARKLARYPIIVDQRPRMNLETIRARALKVKNTKGLSFMVIDHLLLIKGGRVDSMMDRVSEATIEAKNMAKEFRIPVIMLAQILEKKVLESKIKWPSSNHLFGGETIVQNADVVAFVHRPEMLKAREEPAKRETNGKGDEDKSASPWEKWNAQMEALRGKAYIYSNKRRGGAVIEKQEVAFHGPTMSFSDL